MIVGVPQESYPDEARVALVPAGVASLVKAGAEVVVENGAGERAGYSNAEFESKGATIESSREQLFTRSDVVLQVRGLGANPEAGTGDVGLMRQGHTLIAMFEPLTALGEVQAVNARGVSLFAMELIPLITRAQSMDVLSSMATLAGYKAVLLAASHLPKMFPMMMTAAGTITPARVFIVGAGVAGLQAIASSRRLGAVVQAYDVRPVVKEQVESLGGKFVEMELDSAAAEDKGGYAKELGEDFYRRQREMMTRVVGDSDVVITTAAIPGKKAPILVTAEMVREMRPGSVIVDLAAERGGNCELTRPGEVAVEHGVQIIGPLNIPSMLPYHASQMYSKNITTLLLHLMKDGELQLDTEDEITAGTLVTHGGQVAHTAVAEAIRAFEATAGASRGPEE